jgi:hypothetical protein
VGSNIFLVEFDTGDSLHIGKRFRAAGIQLGFL